MLAQPPEPILAVLADGPDTGEVLGALETRGEHVFVLPDGRWWRAPVWWVATERHTWLASAIAEHRWGHAAGDPREVSLDEGWTVDAVRVGDWSMPLKRGTRKAARNLMAQWDAATWGGEPWAPGEPHGPGRAPLGDGATAFPDWWSAGVPCDPEERWLAAAATGETHPFNLRDGRIAHETLWLAVTDRRNMLAARAESGEVWAQRLSAVAREPRPGGARYTATERVFTGPALGGGALARVAELSAIDGADGRWAAAARQALGEREPERALDLWASAFAMGHASRIYEDVSRACLVSERGDVAAIALAEHLVLHRHTDTLNGPSRWRAAPALEVRRLEWTDLWIHVRHAVTHRGLKLPPRLPLPLSSPTQVWVGALCVLERWDDALGLLPQLDKGPRGMALRAAVSTMAEVDEAADAWLAAARTARQAHLNGESREALDQAIALDDGPEARWLAAAWAWSDRDHGVADAHWRKALAMDPGAEHRPDTSSDEAGERALATLASARGAATAAADAWRRVIALNPADPDAYRARAAVLENDLGEPADAARTWEAAVAAMDEELLPTDALQRWRVHNDIARLYGASGDGAAAIGALVASVAGDFLRPEAYQAALERPEVPVPDALGAWWRHLRALLVGGAPDGAPLPVREAFTDEALDALHPGGAGWLVDVRGRLDVPDAPSYRELVRGLERMQQGRQPAAWAVLDAVSRRLGFVDPPATFLYRGEGAWGAAAWPIEPPVILLGFRHLDDSPRRLEQPGLAFLLACELTHLRCDHPVLAFDSDLVGTSRSVYATFGKYAGTAETVFDVVTLLPGIDQVAKIQTLIKVSRRVFAARGAVDKVSGLAGKVAGWFSGDADDPARSLSREGLRGAALQFRVQADRAALLATGDLRAAVDGILRASTSSLDAADRVREEGLAAVLTDAPPDEALRITMLMEFAAQQTPGVEEESEE